jgi:hypothetical protein
MLAGGFLLVALVAAGFLPAQDAGADVDAVLSRYIRASGGRAAIERLTSRVSIGALVTPGGKAALEIRQKAPDKILRIIESPVSGRSENGHDGAVAWSANAQAGVREVSGPEVESLKRELTLQRQILWPQLYSAMRIAGQEAVGGRTATVLEAKVGETISYRMYFDQQTGLLIRSDTTLRGMTIQNFYEDYREVDGVALPFRIRYARSDGFQWADEFTEIRHNVPLEDRQFAKPEAKAAQASQAPAPAPGKAQRRSPIPDTFTNLQALPKDISKQELVNIMKNFCFTMDQRCSYCHVATDDLSSADFPSDEKEPKKKARELLRLILAAKKEAASK